MSKEFNGVALGHIRALFDESAGHGLPDGELLGRFLDDRGVSGEAAFEALVRRHGPLVFGVCRRTLGNSHQAEDAFQATFLLLAKRAQFDPESRGGRPRGSSGSPAKVAARARGDAQSAAGPIEERAAGIGFRIRLVAEPENPDDDRHPPPRG